LPITNELSTLDKAAPEIEPDDLLNAISLNSYFTETWFKGAYLQVPIFVYGFFNQLTVDFSKLTTNLLMSH
jgi:hypothetical protein